MLICFGHGYAQCSAARVSPRQHAAHAQQASHARASQLPKQKLANSLQCTSDGVNEQQRWQRQPVRQSAAEMQGTLQSSPLAALCRSVLAPAHHPGQCQQHTQTLCHRLQQRQQELGVNSYELSGTVPGCSGSEYGKLTKLCTDILRILSPRHLFSLTDTNK